MEKFVSKKEVENVKKQLPNDVKKAISDFAEIIEDNGLNESAIYLLDHNEPTPLDRSGTGSRYDINNAEEECTRTIDGYTFHTIIECDDGNGVLIVRSPSLTKINEDEREI